MSVVTIPRTRDKEQLLAWANRQKKAPLTTVQAAAMDSIYPAWRTTRNGVWYTRLEAVESFFGSHHRFPRAQAEDAEEKSVGIWLATQRQRVGAMSPERRQIIDDRLPGWCLTAVGQTQDTRWDSRFRALLQFHTEHGRLPIQKASEPAEAKLAGWLAVQRKNVEVLAEKRVKALDDGLASWRQNRDENWTEQLHSAAAYLHEHSFFPRSSSDPSVRRMTSWMSAQRKLSQSLSPERLAALNEHIPAWRNRTTVIWLGKLGTVSAYVARTGDLPRLRAADPEEARLASWLTYQRKHRCKLTVEQVEGLDARVPGWAS